MHLNFPPWLEIFLKFTCLKWLKMHLNCPWLEKFLSDMIQDQDQDQDQDKILWEKRKIKQKYNDVVCITL